MSSAPSLSNVRSEQRKRRVFVSSTSKDLREERLALKAALPQMSDVEFCGMEDWTARADPPVKVCLDEVGRSDLYVGIIGNRYGYVDPSSGQSVTEMEYRHARSQGKQCLLYFLEPEAPSDDARFEAFKAELKKNNMVGWFRTPEELAGKVVIGIHNTLHSSAAPAEPVAALMAALFDDWGLRKVFEAVQAERLYAPDDGAAANVARLLEAMRAAGQQRRLLQVLQKQRPEIDWATVGGEGRHVSRLILLAGVAVAVLCLVLLAELIYLPLPVKDVWVDEFEAADSDWSAAPQKTQWQGSLWNAPPQWRIVRGQGPPADNGALLVKGMTPGMRAGLGWRAYTNFDAEFEVRMVRGARAAWIFRGQSGGAGGYVFELVNKDRQLFLLAHIRKNNLLRSFRMPEALVDVGACCQPGDSFLVDAEVRGNQFQFAVTLQRDLDPNAPGNPGASGLKILVPAFTDDAGTYKHGNVGLLQLDSNSESQFERWCVSPSPVPANATSCIPPKS